VEAAATAAADVRAPAPDVRAPVLAVEDKLIFRLEVDDDFI
jgi:hypothetical protein